MKTINRHSIPFSIKQYVSPVEKQTYMDPIYIIPNSCAVVTVTLLWYMYVCAQLGLNAKS